MLKYRQIKTTREVDALTSEEFEAYLIEHRQLNAEYFAAKEKRLRDAELAAAQGFQDILLRWQRETGKEPQKIIVSHKQKDALINAGLWSDRFILKFEANKIKGAIKKDAAKAKQEEMKKHREALNADRKPNQGIGGKQRG